MKDSIRFSHTIFYVKDVKETMHFYEKAFGLEPQFVHESHAYAELKTGNTALAFASNELGAMNLPGGFQQNSLKSLPQACEVAFICNDPDKVYNHAVKCGATAISAPKVKPWGQVVGYLRDPNGILIEVAGEVPRTT